MKKIKIKKDTNEMSTTGTGASFKSGTGEQYASPKAFKITKSKEEGINSPFDNSAPSIPNRPSKAIDYKKLYEKAKKKWNPVTDFTDSQAWAGVNTGYDMDTQDAASVLEEPFKVGDEKTSRGIKTTVTGNDDETGSISWKVDYVPAFDTVFEEFDELKKFITTLSRKTDDQVIDGIATQVSKLFNQYRTHIRKNYPDAYKKYASNPMEEINEARYTQFKKQNELRTPTEQIHKAVREIRRKIDEITKVVSHTERMKTELKASNEGMSYLKRTKNAIHKISEKIQILNNRIKGLTE
mgnify:FL=1|tara:strand:+ start:6023 stop:6910 length:888 start_codon:yes stop_codon:yes gene_type:complete